VYILLSAVVRVKGFAFIDRLPPPVVIAPVIISIVWRCRRGVNMAMAVSVMRS
jgi:uracil permease